MNEESGLREECGVFGCVSTGLCQLDVSAVIATGLTGLQHRLILSHLFKKISK